MLKDIALKFKRCMRTFVTGCRCMCRVILCNPKRYTRTDTTKPVCE